MMNDTLIKVLVDRYKLFKGKKSFDVYDYIFYLDDEKDCGVIDLGSRVFIITPEDLDNCAFWSHEFSELTVIKILTREGYDWHNSVRFKGFSDTYIAHFVTPMGANNKCCLIPQTKKDESNW